MRLPTETPVLRTERVLVRPFQPADVEGRRVLGRDPEIIQMFGGEPEFTEPVPMSDAEAVRLRREGREREAAYVGGAWRDDVIMGILRSDPR